jgi:nitroreductase
MLRQIWDRASVRDYKPDPVPDEALQEVLRAAFHAPTANNARPWHIVVVTDRAKREVLAKTHQYAVFCTRAPMVLAFCADPARSSHWWIEDCSAAVENAMIEAVNQGLGTCWIGCRGDEHKGFDREEHVRQALGIPAHIRVLGLVTLGYPAKEPHIKEPGPMDAVHYEAW